MIIESVDEENSLFSVSSCLPENLLNKLLNINWREHDSHSTGLKDIKFRRTILPLNNSVFDNLNEVMLKNQNQIEDYVQIKFDSKPSTVIWINEPGFIVPLHTDGHVQSGMQIYLDADSNLYGTTFYNFKNESSVKYKCKFKRNCGYLLLNGFNDDGSQPLHWHGMLEPVKKFRLSIYTMFGSYKKI